MHDIQQKMASLHYTKDGKPFYLDPNANQLFTIWTGTGWKVANFNNAQEAKSQFDQERTKRSQSVPTQSVSSVLAEQNDTVSSENSNGTADAHFHRKNSSSPALGIEVAMLNSVSEKEKVQISIQNHLENNGTVRLDESPKMDADDQESEEVDEPTPEQVSSEDKDEE